MGYDCTLHVVDEEMIRGPFVATLLGEPCDFRSSFEDREDAADLWETVRAALRGESIEEGEDPPGPQTVASLVCQLAIAYCEAVYPHHYERGFCLSLWSSMPEEIEADVPLEYYCDPEPLFGPIVKAYPNLHGQFPKDIDWNYSSGVYVSADKVPSLLAWVEQTVKSFDKGERNLFRGLLSVLKHAAANGLAYWEGTELPVPWTKIEADDALPAMGIEHYTIQNEAEGFLYFKRMVNDIVLVSTGPTRSSTEFVDVSTWPPTQQNIRRFAVDMDCSRNGRWLTVANDEPDHPYLYRVRLGDAPHTCETLLLPSDELENGIHEARFIDDRVVAIESKTENGRLLLEQDGQLVPVAHVSTREDIHRRFGVGQLGDGTEVLFWLDKGYILEGDAWIEVFTFESDRIVGDWFAVPCGTDGIYHNTDHNLYRQRMGGEAERLMPRCENITWIGPGPNNTLLLVQGKNKRGDLAVWYNPADDTFRSIEPELLGDKAPDYMDTVTFDADRDCFVAIDGYRYWSIPRKLMESQPRRSAKTNRKVKG